MAYSNQKEFIDILEKHGELIRVKSFVNPKLEIAEITDRISKTKDGGKAILFENTGYDFPVLMNAYGSTRRMCLALGVDSLDGITKEIEDLFKQLMKPRENIIEKLKLLPTLNSFAGWMPKVTNRKAACQQIIYTDDADITKLPIITCWPKDGGPFITLPVIHTKDPNTGIRNVGMYRMQVFDKKLTAMHWHKHKVSARHFNEYKKLGKKMPVAVALGGDPVYAYASTAPLPDNVDEYMLAGFLRKKKVELVKCITQPEIEVPVDADFVIEGYVDPNDDLIWEGPFGDHTGYYSLADWYPKFYITAITHKKNPVYPATIVGIPPQEDAYLGKATERIFLAPIKMTLVPEIIDMEMPVEGVFHNLVIAQIDKSYAGQGQKVMNAMWGAGQMMFNKILVLTDTGTNITNYKELAQYAFKNLDVVNDLLISTGPMDVLDHSCSKMGFGGKLGIDATKKMEEEIDERNHLSIPSIIDVEKIKTVCPQIKEVNASLLSEGIGCLIISVKKQKMNAINILHDKITALKEVEGVKMILYIEERVDPNDLETALWRFCGNMDPKRDSYLTKRTSIKNPSKIFACMGLDGTVKSKAFDNFQRDWPNIVVSDDETIKAVDEKWESLGLGEFIPSPSLKYKHQLYGEEAIAEV